MAQEIDPRAPPLRWLWLALCLALAACSRPADEAALREAVVALRDAVEARETDAVVSALTEDFAGPQGMDRQALRRLLVVQFLRNRSISVTLGPIETRIQGERAEADFRALLAGFDQQLLPARADGYRLRTGWRVEDGRWRLEWAQWE